MTTVGRGRLIDAYVEAKVSIVEEGFGHEIDWQYRLCFDSVSESQFLEELAWVVLNSGMRESVVRARFASVAESFRYWESAAVVAANDTWCREAALGHFAHVGKIEAILSAARRVDSVGFQTIRDSIIEQGARYLESFEYLGPVTSIHLAKNLGLDLVKPDRHLCRVAEAAGYGSPEEMCKVISTATGDRLGIIDLVIWRYATVTRDYCQKFAIA